MALRERYVFGEFSVDVRERLLARGGASVPLPPKAHDVLLALVRRAGRLVTKRELLDLVWPDTFVDEGILSVHISGLRKALGDDRNGHTFIETVSRAGYRFVMPVTALGSADTADGEGTASRRRTPQIHELFGQGRAHLLSASMFEVPKALAAFQAAIDLDPTYAAAHAGLALACCAQAALRVVPHLDAYARAKAAALRALAMDAGCADAQTALGAVLFLSEWDWIGAARSLDRALELAPHHTQAQLLRGQLLESSGQLDRALAMKQRTLERDPLSPAVLLQIALSYWHQRRYDESMRWAMKALEIDPKLLLAREHVIGACWKTGDMDRMLAESIAQAESFGAPAETIAETRLLCDRLKEAYARDGRVGAAMLMRQYALRNPQRAAAVQLSVLSGEVGDLDAAFHHLDRAIDSRDPSLVYLAVAPQWDSLRADVRFAERLARMGLRAKTAGTGD